MIVLENENKYEDYPMMICSNCGKEMEVNANEYDYFYECDCGCLMESDGTRTLVIKRK